MPPCSTHTPQALLCLTHPPLPLVAKPPPIALCHTSTTYHCLLPCLTCHLFPSCFNPLMLDIVLLTVVFLIAIVVDGLTQWNCLTSTNHLQRKFCCSLAEYWLQILKSSLIGLGGMLFPTSDYPQLVLLVIYLIDLLLMYISILFSL